ncbi:hypothetical protein [uncultured Algimonas sp.]|uniref:hypothetical protein n=1 Tax=uncultured Algimonas sp. TaxID=1547920 RepID=UPI002638004C|nr:hypothetical protein [uncultured Algimonas sp.]
MFMPKLRLQRSLCQQTGLGRVTPVTIAMADVRHDPDNRIAWLVLTLNRCYNASMIETFKNIILAVLVFFLALLLGL